MWQNMFLLLLHSVEAAVASQCWQGATFSEAVVSPAVESSGIMRVPGVASLPQCVAACCDLPDYDLAWLFEGRCYILNCQQRENCRPRERPGADSVLAFLRRASPQTLVLQSLVRGEPYSGRWRPLSRSSEAPGDLEALKDLALFSGPRQDFPDPGMQDVEYSEGSQEERGGPGSEVDVTEQPSLKGGDGFNQSEALDSPEREAAVAQNRGSSGGNISGGDEDKTRRPTADPAAAERTTKTESSTDPTPTTPPVPQKPTSDSTQHDHIRTLLTTPATPHQPISTSIQPASDSEAHLLPSPADQPLMVSLGNPAAATLPTVKPEASVSPKPATDMLKMFQSAAGAPPASSHPPARAMTSDPSTTSTPSTDPPTTTEPSVTTAAESVSEVTGSNRGPLAVVGPDRKLFLPVSGLLLNGSGSTDDRGIVSYHWDAVSGPPGLKLEGVDQAVATATGLRVGRYTFRLTVCDQEGATDSAALTVRVQEARSLLPVAHASGSHTLTLPNNSLVLRGSVTDGDQTEVHYLWVRDSQSPAAGDVLYSSDTQASLYLANLVEGTYLFQLRVTDAQARSSSATATVEVRPEPGGGEEVELEMLVSVSQVSVAQRDTVVRQLAALLHVLDSDIQVRALQGHSHLSTVLRFSVRGPSGPIFSGSRLVGLLRNQLLREKSDYLLFRVLRVDTVLCLLRCSGRGQCDPISKECTCDPFWTENLIRRYLGDGESNCEWRVLYVILTSFMLMVFILSVSWTFICCCRRRRQTKVRKKTKYTILDNMDEQERVELRPKFSIKHRSTEHNSSLMMSESELDSDQDTIFSRDRPVRSRNRLSAQAIRNGNAFG
ncbi:dyslexia-associated protein KIAA0319 homolog isoform X1 [Acanthopagrus latus]|uniref:dyslexia-associated protein KIAA0319 homolog isoform X1 n=1 Tax=Acanthopagrus latus TaxID=8177 RepID=UPI00187CD2B6|nr:dyslexia-associated protein KIAA0319 homolog isoform X1 [Acanthopagrus latus]XP_036930527.1 dyslexia-associated protein KIAA0319 homolog isoform X1 [Acanthopagrus latus]XP_036930528.1 dyslexia-associated protein KIAA0319 homolog isoform X1 [Acanthopagrus latus]